METKIITCAQCGEEIDIEDAIEIDGKYYCSRCAVRCEDCSEYVLKHEATYLDAYDKYVCDDCLEACYTRCDNCDQYVDNDEIYVTHDGDRICQDCYENSYTRCGDCGEIYPSDEMHYMDDGNAYCDECYEEHDGCIKSYHSFGSWDTYRISSDDNPILKGFELEVQASDSCATDLNYALHDLCVYERDGSVYDGFEIITNPFSREWLKSNQSRFKRMYNILEEYGFDDEDCGLHIHVTRDKLKTSELSSDDVIDNILIIMETFKKELVKFSRRNSSEIDQWCGFLTSTDEHVTIKKIQQKKDSERYHALNVKNSKTIEFRIFKQARNFEQLMAALELVDNIVDIARENSLDGLKWKDIVEYGGEYIQQYNESLNILSDTKLVIANLTQEYDGLMYSDYQVGDVVLYNEKKAVIVKVDTSDGTILIAIENFHGHSAGCMRESYVKTQFANHMWFVRPDDICHVFKPINPKTVLDVGTRVLVRDDLRCNCQYGKNSFVDDMGCLSGKISIILSNTNGRYNQYCLEGCSNDYWWTNEMLASEVSHVDIEKYMH